jgi:hypothetical protein
MPTGVYIRTKSKIKRFWSDKARENHMRVIPKGENHHYWDGDLVSYRGLHKWIRKNKLKPKLCERCNKNKSREVANISGKYKRDINDFEWLCNKCHVSGDGRLEILRNNGKSPYGFREILICLYCKKDFSIYPYYKNKRKYCSRDCYYKFYRELRSKQ